ncbi:MmyB family transcriptional regulator [Nocardia asteroides]
MTNRSTNRRQVPGGRRQSARNKAATVPNFADTARRIRDDLGLTREDVTGISRAHLARIENGLRPSDEMVENLLTAYDADEDLTRHLWELRTPPETLESDHIVRARIANDAILRHQLDALDQRGTLGAYLDPLWNVMFANRAFRETLAGIDGVRSLALWTFSDAAERVLLDIEHERAHTVASLRAASGRVRDSPHTSKLLRILTTHPEFHRLWAGAIHVEYGRSPGDLSHAREPNGELASYRISFTEWIPPHRVQLFTAERQPYAGPWG